MLKLMQKHKSSHALPCCFLRLNLCADVNFKKFNICCVRVLLDYLLYTL